MAYWQAKARARKLNKTYEKTDKYGKKRGRGGVWFDEDTGRFRKYTASNTPGLAKYLRRVSNKKVRKSNDPGNYAAYRRQFDYWWDLF